MAPLIEHCESVCVCVIFVFNIVDWNFHMVEVKFEIQYFHMDFHNVQNPSILLIGS